MPFPKKGIASRIRGTLLLLLFLGTWHGLSRFYSPVILPSPEETFKTLLSFLEEPFFYDEILYTLQRLLIGFGAALLGGTSLGLLMGLSKSGKDLVLPGIYFLQSIPPILFMTLGMIWFGLSGKASIFIVFIVGLPVMAVSIQEGFDHVDPKLREMGELFRFSRIKILREILLPSLGAPFRSGAIFLAGLSWKLVIMGEVLSSSTGIGARITEGRLNLLTEEVFAWSFVVIAFCFLSQKSVGLLRILHRTRRRSLW